MSFFTSSILRPMSHSDLAKKAPAIFAEAPKTSTSDRYLFIPTIKLVDGLAANGWSVVSAVQQGNMGTKDEDRMTNKHALFLARTDILGRNFNQGDTLPLLKLENSHNGLSSFHMTTGFFRKACANGLTIPESIFASPKVKHTIDMKDQVIEASYKVLRDFPRLTEMQRTLSTVTLDTDERMLLADAAADIFFTKEERDRNAEKAAKYRNDRYLIDAQLITPRRYEDKKSDLWTVSNVIQENLIRGNVQTVSDNGSMRSKRKVTSIDRDNDIHEKLFALTQKFAQLKGVQSLVVA